MWMDCLSGENSWEKVGETTDNLKLVLNSVKFCLRGLTFSGISPPNDLSRDGVCDCCRNEMVFKRGQSRIKHW